MSNTLNTPVEALELEFPLRVVEYALRRGSGGGGRYRGGDGVVRELEALAPMTYSLLTERAVTRRPARTAASPAPAAATCSTARAAAEGAWDAGSAGQRLRVETPGGEGRTAGWPPNATEKPQIQGNYGNPRDRVEWWSRAGCRSTHAG